MNALSSHILVADDDQSFRTAVMASLRDEGFSVRGVSGGKEALETLSKERVDLIVSDLVMEDMTGTALLAEVRRLHPGVPTILMTGHGSIQNAVEAMREGAYDYLTKPFRNEELFIRVRRALDERSRNAELERLREVVETTYDFSNIISQNDKMRHAFKLIRQVAETDVTVLVLGETGTGKELVARAVHVLSPRADGPFVPVNCGAIPESLIEGELFGHEKGAFTGAYATRKGKFEMASNGTLFLDEIGDMPLLLQMRLLRVLEEGKVYRVGGENPVRISVRVIAATRVDLEKAVRDGLFREDLYYRLNVLRIGLPPLRDRVEDIPLLAVHFLDRAFAEMGRAAPYPSLSSETIYLLEGFPWKGNVRELRNIMTRVATLLPPDTKRIFPFHILPHLGDVGELQRSSAPERAAGGIVLRQGISIDEAEEVLINEALNQTGGNRTKAAKLLGISLRTLRRKLNKT